MVAVISNLCYEGASERGIHHSLIIHMTGQGEKVLFREEGVELSLDDVYDAREIVSKHAKVTPRLHELDNKVRPIRMYV